MQIQIPMPTPPMSTNAGYKIVFIDKTSLAKAGSQLQSLHYVQAYAVKDRVNYLLISSHQPATSYSQK